MKFLIYYPAFEIENKIVNVLLWQQEINDLWIYNLTLFDIEGRGGA